MLARASETSQAYPAYFACSKWLAKLKKLVPISQHEPDLQIRVAMRIVSCLMRDETELVQLILCL